MGTDNDSREPKKKTLEQELVYNEKREAFGALVPSLPSSSAAFVPPVDFPIANFNMEEIATTPMYEALASSFLQPTWPATFPADCPPVGSSESNETIIRVLYDAVPSAADFTSWMEENHPDPKNPCQSCGLSVYLESGHLLTVAKRIPALRGRHYAGLRLVASDGKLMNTPSQRSQHHHTWWKASTCVAPEKRCQVLGVVPV